MGELDDERRQLAKADQDIAAGEARIARQRDLIERLQKTPHDASDAEALLGKLEEVVRAWRDHRTQILRRIDYLETEERNPISSGRPMQASSHPASPERSRWR
ncbi:MAG TPA: hypothetical protein VHL31_13125 [Geminicoccus sp.]|jgi:septal ring factor EnvC (AmiA/AmiB activator)|uniref:hypothetical protein n=1 Tax=Geminicoccus sp. TaxID=2024832 RepID=UPI002E31171B|nr:hypothetical protein [Geminicoccus sp.]HEX2527223.1 hypothetical protein [Geminicoccus sp.]